MEMGRAGWPPASEGVRQAAPALVVGALNGWTELDRAGRRDGGHRAPTAGPFSQWVAQSPPVSAAELADWPGSVLPVRACDPSVYARGREMALFGTILTIL